MYWNLKQNEGIWNYGAFVTIIKTCENILSGQHSIAAGDIFCNYWGPEEAQQYDSKKFKPHFEVLMTLYDDLSADCELTIGDKDLSLLFFYFVLHTAMCLCVCSKQKISTRSRC